MTNRLTQAAGSVRNVVINHGKIEGGVFRDGRSDRFRGAGGAAGAVRRNGGIDPLIGGSHRLAGAAGIDRLPGRSDTLSGGIGNGRFFLAAAIDQVLVPHITDFAVVA